MTELPFNDEIEARIGHHLVNFGFDEVRRLMVEYAEGQVAAHTAKLLADVEMPESVHVNGEVEYAFLYHQLQAYAAAAAAQARLKALDEANGVCLTIAEVALCTNKGEMARKTSATAESCAKAIESLKGKL